MAESHALTLRLDERLYEPVRREAFDRRIPISEVIREAIDKHIAAGSTNGCDVCGKPSTHVTTPGGLRGCSEHLALTCGPTDRRVRTNRFKEADRG